jgi:PTS system cellobiose-specific IIC component
LVAVRESLPRSFFALLAALPVFMALAPGSFLQRLVAAELPAFGVMGIALAIILSYRLALHLHLMRGLVVGVTCVAFVLALPRPFSFDQPIAYLKTLGGVALFLAIVLALLVAGACALGRRAGLRGQAVGAIVVLAALGAIFAMQISPSNVLTAWLAPLGRLGDSYPALMTIVALETALWIVGIHGPATLAAVVTPLYLTLQAQNTAAFLHHAPLPHVVVISLFLFVFPGGAGATLPIAFLLFFSRAPRLRLLARATVLPSLCNINEPLLFGLPIVLNPFLMVPFVGVPLITATVAYFATANGLVARAYTYIPAAVPSPLAVYLATLDWRAVVLVLVNIALATLLYFPFVRAYEQHEVAAA